MRSKKMGEKQGIESGEYYKRNGTSKMGTDGFMQALNAYVLGILKYKFAGLFIQLFFFLPGLLMGIRSW
jgi:hypothetical protein